MSRSRTIRLACLICDRQDFDGISAAELRQAIRAGCWTDVERLQTYRQACQTHAVPATAPPGYSVLDWWTHLGICPDCQPQ